MSPVIKINKEQAKNNFHENYFLPITSNGVKRNTTKHNARINKRWRKSRGKRMKQQAAK